MSFIGTVITADISDNKIYIRQNINDIQYSQASGVWTNITQWPVNIVNQGENSNSTATVSIITNLNFSTFSDSITDYFIPRNDLITFDGNNNTISLFSTTTNKGVWNGLITNGTSSSGSEGPGNNDITIQNIIIHSSNNISAGEGYICRSYFGRSASNNIIQNCSVINTPPATYTAKNNWGGICGSNMGFNNGNVIIRKCFTDCKIDGENSGGICGTISNGQIINCYSTGIIFGRFTGGIGGSNCGDTLNGNGLNILNCYSTGNIVGEYAGGICGNIGIDNEKVNIKNCYSVGSITGTNAEGIITIANTKSNSGLVENCYIANNNWTDFNANLNLIFFLYNENQVWVSIALDTPYVLNITSLDYSLPNDTVSYSIGQKINYNTSPISANKNYILLKVNNAPPPSNITVSSTNGTLTFNNITPTSNNDYIAKVFCFTGVNNNIYYGYSQCTFTLTLIPIGNICFIKGTLITTDQGIIPIEKIDCNLQTIYDKKILAITKSISTDGYSICFEKNALGNNIPSIDTTVSIFHSVYNFKKREMMKAHHFTKDYDKVYRVPYNKEILYNILMEKHEKIMVNNLICETLEPYSVFAKIYNPKSKNIIIELELKKQQLKEKQLKEHQLKEQQLKEQQLKEQQLKEHQLKQKQLKQKQLKEEQLKQKQLKQELLNQELLNQELLKQELLKKIIVMKKNIN
jgi:hypothetical protein